MMRVEWTPSTITVTKQIRITHQRHALGLNQEEVDVECHDDHKCSEEYVHAPPQGAQHSQVALPDDERCQAGPHDTHQVLSSTLKAMQQDKHWTIWGQNDHLLDR